MKKEPRIQPRLPMEAVLMLRGRKGVQGNQKAENNRRACRKALAQ